MANQSVAIVGAGIFGVTAAIALHRRGYTVSLFDPGPLPHPLAASTDISKSIGADYGSDEDYTALAERALEGWLQWNAVWPEPLFHETGAAYVCQSPMAPGGFEYESYQMLLSRGHAVERLNATEIHRRFPAWNADLYVDGYFNAASGYGESGKAVAHLIAEAQSAGVKLFTGHKFTRLHEAGSRVAGIVNNENEVFPADWVVVAAGSWTPHALPFMAEYLRSVGQPVFHLKPVDPRLYQPDFFPMFGADLVKTGYYGFPVNRAGVIKIAHHGVGRQLHPESPERVVTPQDVAELREFLHGTFPGLADVPIVYTRLCLYCDTYDEHFWIARDPQREGLVVASGDSGHGFKFAPLLGDIIADALEGAPNPILRKFRWRPELQPVRGEEALRRIGDQARHRPSPTEPIMDRSRGVND